MKSSHRHELKTNELAEWFSNLPQWFKDNNKYIIGLTLIVAVILAAFIIRGYIINTVLPQEETEFTNQLNTITLMKYQIANSQANGQDISYYLKQELQEPLDSVASSASKNNMSALALIKEAEVLRAEIHYRLQEASEENLKTQIEQAKLLYNEAVIKASASSLLLAEAKYGIGLCEEELGNFDQAKQIYQEIADNSDFNGTVAQTQAEFRIETMDDYKQNIVFEPRPAVETTISPDELQIIPSDVNDANALMDINLPFDINISPEIQTISSTEDMNSAAESLSIIPDSIEVNVPVE